VVARYGTDLALAERTAHERLTRICFVDYDREIALVAEAAGEEGPVVAGVARLSRIHATQDVELSLVVADAWQRRRIGRELLDAAIDVARHEPVGTVVAHLDRDNEAMRRLLADAGFAFETVGGRLVARLEMTGVSREPEPATVR
jgi:acetyltransferase